MFRSLFNLFLHFEFAVSKIFESLNHKEFCDFEYVFLKSNSVLNQIELKKVASLALRISDALRTILGSRILFLFCFYVLFKFILHSLILHCSCLNLKLLSWNSNNSISKSYKQIGHQSIKMKIVLNESTNNFRTFQHFDLKRSDHEFLIFEKRRYYNRPSHIILSSTKIVFLV